MLSYALAITVALSSLVLFSTAFLMSDIHRKDDFLWSGVGLIYALILWFCARNITGAVLLGQAAAAALLVSYNWQTLKLRKAIANPEKADELNNFSVLQAVKALLKRGKSEAPTITTPPTVTTPKVTEQEIAIPDTTSNETESQSESQSLDNQAETNVETSPSSQSNVSSSVTEVTNTNNESEVLSESESLESQKKATNVDTKLDEVLDETTTEQVTTDNAPSNDPTTEEQLVVPVATPVVDTPDNAETVVNVEANQPTETKEIDPEPEDQTTIFDEDNQENQSTVTVSETPPAEIPQATKENEPETKVAVQDEEIDISSESEVNVFTESEVTQIQTPDETQKSEVNVFTESEVTQIQTPDETQKSEVNVFTESEVTQIQTPDETQKIETQNLSEIIKNNPDYFPNIVLDEINSVSENEQDNDTFEVIEKNQKIESEKKESPLDSLETVEVAEILEADPDELSAKRKEDQSNIIEVTTTEINIATESAKMDHNQDTNYNPESSKDT